MGRSKYSNCESEPDNMARESSAAAPVNPPAAVNPLAKPLLLGPAQDFLFLSFKLCVGKHALFVEIIEF